MVSTQYLINPLIKAPLDDLQGAYLSASESNDTGQVIASHSMVTRKKAT